MESMDKDEFFEKLWTTIVVTLVIAGVAISLCCCKTTRVVTEYRDREVHDTICKVDSVWQDRWHTIQAKGDTIYKLDSVVIREYHIKHEVRDSIVVDSIPYEVFVTKEVPVKSAYIRFTSWFFWIVVIASLLLIGWRIAKKFYLRK